MGIVMFMSCNSPKPADNSSTVAPADAKGDATPAVVIIEDTKLIEDAKANLARFSAKDVDGFLAGYDDNVIWYFNNGDSIVGKAAVSKYWKDRFANTIDSISFQDDIWLAVDINKPAPTVRPGKWVMSWYRVNARYKTGKTMTQDVHTVSHYNAEGKVDGLKQYLDRASIMEAMKK